MTRILLAVSGSVASIKLAQLYAALKALGEVQVVATAAAQNFIQHLDGLEDVQIIKDSDEWNNWKAVGDSVVHIELRRWADVLVIAPLSANTLAKVATGLCDNLLTCVVRAWDWAHDPVVVAPAMNTLMWDSPFTAEHLARLVDLGAVVVPPVAKTLACGDVGLGAMASPQAIADVVGAVITHKGSQPLPDAPHSQLQQDSGASTPGSSWRDRLKGVVLPHSAYWKQQADPPAAVAQSGLRAQMLLVLLSGTLGASFVLIHGMLYGGTRRK